MLPRLAKNKTNLLNSHGEFSTSLIITEYSVLFWQTKKETAYVAAPVPATVDQQYVKEKRKDYFDIPGTKLSLKTILTRCVYFYSGLSNILETVLLTKLCETAGKNGLSSLFVAYQPSILKLVW